jgi:hypothetical protein
LKEITMAKSHLLSAVCTVALLAASPVFAQSSTQAGETAAGRAAGGAAPSSTGPAGVEKPMHNMDMGKHQHPGMMHGSKGDRSQDAMVDRLNERSYQAAQQGQSFSLPAAGSGDAAMPAGGGTHDMSGHGASGGKM